MKATEKEKEKMRAYYLKNRDRIIKRQNEYRKINREDDLRRKREYNRKNRTKLSIWMRGYIQRKREEIIKKLGSKCCRCGLNDIRALHINHKKVKTKTHRRDFMRKKFDLSKVEILCANCHAIEHYEFFKTNQLKHG